MTRTRTLTRLPMRARTKNPWKTLSTREIYSNPWVRVSESSVLTPAGTPGIYGVVSFRNVAVGVVAIDKDDRILMVGQYRYALDAYSWEIPEGGCPEGTRPLAAAKRELREETGYSAKTWKKILTLHLSNSVTNERAEIYLADDLTPGRSEPEETEKLEVVWVPFSEALRLVRKGEITDAISVAAILGVASSRELAREKSLGRAKAKKPGHQRHRAKGKKR